MRRDTFTMKIDIMKALHEPIIITHIMQKAGINCHRIKEELEYLIMKKLVTMVMPSKKPFQQYNNENRHRLYYVLTPEGTQLLNTLLKAKTILMEPS